MNKFLISAAVAIAGLAAPAAGAKQIFSAQDRGQWFITGCSEHNDNSANDKDGGYDRIKDGNNATFWHSEYNKTGQGHPNGMPHYLLIDRGADAAATPFDGFGFLPRQHTTGNGYVQEYALYVVNDTIGLQTARHADDAPANTAAAITDSHNSLTTFLEGKTAAIEGNLGCVHNDVATHDLKNVVFDEPQTGRFVLFVIKSVSGQAANQHANCAEFYLYDVEEIDTESAKAKVDLYAPMVPASAIEAAKTAIDAATTTVEIDNAISSVLDLVAGQVVTIKNVRRSAQNKPGYLTYISGRNKLNTATGVTELGKWMLKRVAGTEYFKIFNPQSKGYISAADNSTITTDANNACQVTLCANTDPNNPGTALRFINSQDGLNISDNISDADNLTHWSYNDGGSSWLFSLVSVTADELDTTGATYYRIRSARGQEQNDALGLLGINTVVENGTTAGNESYGVLCRQDGLGTLWTIHSTGNDDGKVYLRNAAADFQGMDACYGLTGNNPGATSHSGATQAIVSATPAPVAIVTAKGANGSTFNKNERGLAICTNTDNHLFLDNTNANNSVPKFSGWDRVDNNFPNNGGVYYFELAEDAQDIIDAYIASASVNTDEITTFIDNHATLSALWDAEAVATAREAAAAVEVPSVTTVKEANAGIGNVNAEFDAIKLALVNSAAGKTVQFENVERNSGSGHFMTYVENAGSHSNDGDYEFITIANTDNKSLRSLWTLVNNPADGSFKLTNYHSGQSMLHRSAGETAQPMDNEGSYFFLEPNNSAKNGEGLVLQIRAGNDCLHEHSDGQGNRIVKWSNAAGSSASGWRVTMMDAILDSEALTVTLSDYNAETDSHVISISHPTSAITLAPEAETSVLRVILGAKAAAFSARSNGNEFSAADIVADTDSESKYTITVPGKLEASNYEVQIPAGMFAIGSGSERTLTAGSAGTFSVDGDGVTTGINGVAANGTIRSEIYDLQGRRLAAPVKGINIVNGKKILVK